MTLDTGLQVPWYNIVVILQNKKVRKKMAFNLNRNSQAKNLYYMGDINYRYTMTKNMQYPLQNEMTSDIALLE